MERIERMWPVCPRADIEVNLASRTSIECSGE